MAPASLKVPTDLPTLPEACAKIPEDGTIFLNRGVHKDPETITITKNKTITGDVKNPEYVVLQGGEESVLRLQSGFAEIAGLTIQNEGKERPEDFPEDKEPAIAARSSALVVSAPLCAIHDCVFESRNCGGFIVNTKDSNPGRELLRAILWPFWILHRLWRVRHVPEQRRLRKQRVGNGGSRRSEQSDGGRLHVRKEPARRGVLLRRRFRHVSEEYNLFGHSMWYGNWDVSGTSSRLVREGNTPNE